MGDDTNSTRRRVLRTVGGVAVAGLAGCVGDVGGGSTATPTGESMGNTDSMGSTDSMDGTATETQSMNSSPTETESMGDSPTATETTDGSMATTFTVTLENVSDGQTLRTMDGSVPVPLSPGAYAVYGGMGHLFAPGEAASAGLESLAEDGMPGALAEEVAGSDGVLASGVFDAPEGADGPGPLMPGQRYSFDVEADAAADPSLSLATMFVQSNDLFYAPGPGGIALFEDGEPVEGEVTMALTLWDAGTEQNQPPGEGGDQAPRQSGADTGADESAPVRRISEVDDGHDYPSTGDVLKATVTTM